VEGFGNVFEMLKLKVGSIAVKSRPAMVSIPVNRHSLWPGYRCKWLRRKVRHDMCVRLEKKASQTMICLLGVRIMQVRGQGVLPMICRKPAAQLGVATEQNGYARDDL
jgi:hypothetical protein